MTCVLVLELGGQWVEVSGVLGCISKRVKLNATKTCDITGPRHEYTHVYIHN